MKWCFLFIWLFIWCVFFFSGLAGGEPCDLLNSWLSVMLAQEGYSCKISWDQANLITRKKIGAVAHTHKSQQYVISFRNNIGITNENQLFFCWFLSFVIDVAEKKNIKKNIDFQVRFAFFDVSK